MLIVSVFGAAIYIADGEDHYSYIFTYVKRTMRERPYC